MARNPATGSTANKIVVPIPVHVNRFAVRSQHQHMEKMVLSGPKPELRKNNGQTMELGGFERFSLDMTLKSVNFWTKFQCSKDFSLSNKSCNLNCRRIWLLFSSYSYELLYRVLFRYKLTPEPSTLFGWHWSGTKAPISRSRFSQDRIAFVRVPNLRSWTKTHRALQVVHAFHRFYQFNAQMTIINYWNIVHCCLFENCCKLANKTITATGNGFA